MARKFSKAFYNSKEWAKVREAVMMRDKYLCQHCGKPAEEVHHIIHLSPRNINDPSITLNMDNLVSLCKDCHFEEHKREKRSNVSRANKRRVRKRLTNEDGTYIDSNGYMTQRKVHIVYGAPTAGKTTYVKEHKEEHDLVIDTDAIIAAFQLSDKRYIGNNLLYLALDVRDFLIDELAKGNENFDCHNVWIIGGYPKRDERNELAQLLGADLIYVASNQRETESRAKLLNRFDDVQYSIDIVNEYWRKYEP